MCFTPLTIITNKTRTITLFAASPRSPPPQTLLRWNRLKQMITKPHNNIFYSPWPRRQMILSNSKRNPHQVRQPPGSKRRILRGQRGPTVQINDVSHLKDSTGSLNGCCLATIPCPRTNSRESRPKSSSKLRLNNQASHWYHSWTTIRPRVLKQPLLGKEAIKTWALVSFNKVEIDKMQWLDTSRANSSSQSFRSKILK